MIDTGCPNDCIFQGKSPNLTSVTFAFSSFRKNVCFSFLRRSLESHRSILALFSYKQNTLLLWFDKNNLGHDLHRIILCPDTTNLTFQQLICFMSNIIPTDICSLRANQDPMLLDRKPGIHISFMQIMEKYSRRIHALYKALWSLYGTEIGNQWLSPDWGSEFFQVIIFSFL